jgi:glutathione S-transferase
MNMALQGAGFTTGANAQAAQFHKLAGILDARLAQSAWVCGDAPTIADIALASPIHLHAWQKLPLADHPNLVGACDRICGQELTPREAAGGDREAGRLEAVLAIALDLLLRE